MSIRLANGPSRFPTSEGFCGSRPFVSFIVMDRLKLEHSGNNFLFQTSAFVIKKYLTKTRQLGGS